MPGPAIEVLRLVREFKGGVRAVDGIDLEVARGRDLRLPRAERRGQVDDRAHADDAAAADRGHRAGRRASTSSARGPQVRQRIGAALQEAALDPLLTGREHLRLQAALQALPRAERRPRADELLERVGLTEAADRKVRGYSGGMKRRLDLALALVHRPRILFLDEPTTGLDLQSRTALWDGGRPARARGRRHRLPDDAVPGGGRRARRPRRDHRPRPHRRRGHARRAEGRGRPADRRGAPAERADEERLGAVLARFGEPRPLARTASRCGSTGEADLAAIVRALDAEGIAIENLQLHQPSLDDVFLAKTGRSLEGAEDDEEPRSRAWRWSPPDGRRRRLRRPGRARSRAARSSAPRASRRAVIARSSSR